MNLKNPLAHDCPYIIHVVRQYAPAVGGLENFVQSLAQQQALRGLQVSVITLNRNFATGGTLPQFESVNGIPVTRLSFKGSKRYPFALGVLKHIPKGSVVHVHCTDFFSDFLALTRPIHGCTLFLSTHGGFFHTPYAGRFKLAFFHTVTRLSLLFYRQVFACSIGDFDRFRKISSKVTLVENGIDTAKFLLTDLTESKFPQDSTKPSVHDPKFVFIGRFSTNKRISALIESLSGYLTKHSGSRLYIVGIDYDNLAASLGEQIQRLQLESQVQLVQAASDEAIAQIVSASDFIVSASNYEGFGMTILEGMAAGLLPIVSPIPSFTQIVDHAGLGLVHDFEQPVDLHFEQFVQQALEQREQLGAQARAYAQNYSWESVEQTFFTQYQRLLGLGVRHIQGLAVHSLELPAAIGLVQARIEAREPMKVAFINAHTANLARDDQDYRNLLQGFTLLNDGIGMQIASKLKYGRGFAANLNGTDFIPELLKSLKPSRIYLLGSAPGVAQKASAIWQSSYPQHQWMGAEHGFVDTQQSVEICKQLRDERIDVLLVGMGNPLQERWIDEHFEASGVALAVGVGALFDFTAQVVPRAPNWVRSVHMEWAYRLVQEPGRLWRRYLIGNLSFLVAALKEAYCFKRYSKSKVPAHLAPANPENCGQQNLGHSEKGS